MSVHNLNLSITGMVWGKDLSPRFPVKQCGSLIVISTVKVVDQVWTVPHYQVPPVLQISQHTTHHCKEESLTWSPINPLKWNFWQILSISCTSRYLLNLLLSLILARWRSTTPVFIPCRFPGDPISVPGFSALHYQWLCKQQCTIHNCLMNRERGRKVQKIKRFFELSCL